MTTVYVVHVIREGDSGADMLPIGVYSTEFVARRVAEEHELFVDEWITVAECPVLDVAMSELEWGEANEWESPVLYRREGWATPASGSA